MRISGHYQLVDVLQDPDSWIGNILSKVTIEGRLQLSPEAFYSADDLLEVVVDLGRQLGTKLLKLILYGNTGVVG